MRLKEGVGVKDTMKRDDRPARTAWLYVMRQRTGQIKAARRYASIHFLLRKRPFLNAVPPSHIYLR